MGRREILLVMLFAALAGAAFFLTGERGGAAPVVARGPADPYHPASAADAVLVRYKVEGGLSQLSLFEATIRGPGDCAVRYQVRGRPVVERAVALSEAQFRDLLDRLARANFFDVEEVSRNAYYADAATITIALTVGDAENTVRIDARRRPSRDIAQVLDFFDALRKAATPDAVATGD